MRKTVNCRGALSVDVPQGNILGDTSPISPGIDAYMTNCMRLEDRAVDGECDATAATVSVDGIDDNQSVNQSFI